MIRVQLKAWTSQFDKYQEIFQVSLSEVQDTEIMTYDTINEGLYMQLQHESELKNK